MILYLALKLMLNFFIENGDVPKKKRKLNAETARISFLEPKRTSEKSKNNIRRPSGQYSASKRLSLKKVL